MLTQYSGAWFTNRNMYGLAYFFKIQLCERLVSVSDQADSITDRATPSGETNVFAS